MPADADKVERLIIDTISGLAENGIDPPTLEAALNTVEFHLRENNTGAFPRGIVFMLRSLRTWLHGRDPLSPLAFEAPLAAIKAHVAAGERYFENLIRRQFIDSQHRTVLILRPDQEQAEREAKEEEARLAKARAAMSKADLNAVVEATHTLKVMQERPDPPEALATIPTLRLADLPRHNKAIPIEVTTLRDTRVLYPRSLHQRRRLSRRRLRPAHAAGGPRLLRAAVRPRSCSRPASAMTTSCGCRSGSAGRPAASGRSAGRRRLPAGATCAAWLNLRGKALPEQTGELLSILHDILARARLDNRERFQQLVLEEKAAVESRLVPAGSSYVDRRLRANFFESDWADEQMGGVSYLFFLRKLVDQVETGWDGVLAALERIRSTLFNRAAMLCNVTATAADWNRVKPQLADFLGALPHAPVKAAPWQVADTPRAEGLIIPAKVNYVGKGADLYRAGVKPSGAHIVARRYLRTTWLWDKVRVQGGAYGGQCMFDRYSGGFTFVSYRDPNLLATLDIYDRTADFLRNADLSDAELTRNIIGTIGEVDTYRLPDAKGFTSMQRHLIGDTDEARQRMREEILSTTAAELRNFADAMVEVATHGRIAVLGSEQAIEGANKERPGLLSVSRVM